MIGLIGLAGTPDGLGCPCAGTDGLGALGACPPIIVSKQFDCAKVGVVHDCILDPRAHPNCCGWLNHGTMAAIEKKCGITFGEAGVAKKAGVPTWAWVLGGVAVVGVGAVLLLGGKKKYRSNRRDRRRTAGGLRHRRALRRRREREERELHGPKPRRPKYV